MLTKDDLLDIVMERLDAQPLSRPVAGCGASAPTPVQKRNRLDDEIRGREFLSEYDIRKQLTDNSQELKISKDAIISPLAEDWLTLKRIRIIRQ